MAASQAPSILSIETGGGKSVDLVLGLQWKRLVTREDDEVASSKEIARKAGSNHLLLGRGLSRGPIRIIGHAKLPKLERACFSAAYALQIEHDESETVIAGITIDGSDAVWVCAVSQGLICHGFDVVLPLEAAQTKVQQFVETQGEYAAKITYYGDLFQNGAEKSLRDLADYAANHHPEACRVDKLESKASIPKPVFIGCGLIALALLGKYGWEEYAETQRKKKLAELEASQVPDLAPAEVWRKSLQVWSEGKRVTKFSAIEEAIRGLGELATDVAGWKLSTVRCARESSTWKCEASYLREDGSDATSKGFLASLHGPKNVQWTDLNTAKLQISLPTSERKIVIDELPEAQSHLVNLVSALQHSQPAFVSVGRLPAFAAVAVPAIKREDGSQYVMDPAAARPRPLVASLEVAGPVRSVFALKDFDIDWREFTVTLKAIGTPTIKESAINFTVLKGDVYAVQK